MADFPPFLRFLALFELSSSASSGSSVAGGDLSTLVSLQREGWGFLRSSLSSLGVV